MSFQAQEVHAYKKPFREWFREDVPGPDAVKRSGIYFITDLDGTVLYIGKAAADNLGREIWGKFSASTIENKDASPFFENSSLAKWARLTDHKEMIKKGNVDIRAVLISPKEFSSLAEVYLHVLCERGKDFPVLNKRIG